MQKTIESKVSTPKLFESNQGYLHKIKINKSKFRLCVLDYIKGDNLYNLNENLTIEQIVFLANQAAIINQIDLKPEFVYDSWSVSNFDKEYKKKSEYLSESDLKLVQPLAKEFNSLNIKNLPHCFTHGDIINTNVMKDKQDNLYVIDFAVSNIYPRIQELAILACNIFFDKENNKNSENNLKIALDEYQKHIKLTDLELKTLPTYIKFAHAMHLLSANYEKIKNNNNSEENEYWLNLGRTGLMQNKKKRK